jgi:hypothetical protein
VRSHPKRSDRTMKNIRLGSMDMTFHGIWKISLLLGEKL